MRRRAPRSSRRPPASSRLRQHGLAGLPLLAGFIGALAWDSTGDRAEASPLVPPALAVAARGEHEAVPPASDSVDNDEDEPTMAVGSSPHGAASGALVRGPEGQRQAPVGQDVVEEPEDGAARGAALAAASSAVPASRVTSTTRESKLEAALKRTLVEGKTPYAATVLLEAQTGRVLAVAEHSTQGSAQGLALRPMAPAASVFKIVTTAALLDAGVAGSAQVCTHGGRTRMQPALLVDNLRRDRECHPFADALPKSQNVAIAKLALKHLNPDRLRLEAARWGFDAPLPAAGLTVRPSTTVIPDDPFGFAEAAAGFGDVKLSAMHGAVLASIVANQGLLVPPVMNEDVAAPAPTRVVSVSSARKLQAMMTETVKTGTARRAFGNGPRLGVSAAGKTGSLADYQTGLDTSWFVGFAPAERPEVIVATVVVNTAKWHVKATAAAKEALRAYFHAHPPTTKAAVVASRH